MEVLTHGLYIEIERDAGGASLFSEWASPPQGYRTFLFLSSSDVLVLRSCSCSCYRYCYLGGASSNPPSSAAFSKCHVHLLAHNRVTPRPIKLVWLCRPRFVPSEPKTVTFEYWGEHAGHMIIWHSRTPRTRSKLLCIQHGGCGLPA